MKIEVVVRAAYAADFGTLYVISFIWMTAVRGSGTGGAAVTIGISGWKSECSSVGRGRGGVIRQVRGGGGLQQ